MIYSVWNQGAKLYNYFETPEVADRANAPKPSHIPAGKFGATPEVAAWPLPTDSKPIGQGPLPQGRIASTESSASAGAGARLWKWAIFGGVGYATYRWLNKR